MARPKIRSEKYELPASLDGICALVREIIVQGHVRRIELDMDDPYVRAHRWVPDNGLEEEAVTWDSALRDVQIMQEYYSDGATSFQVIVDMLLLAQDEGLHGACWVMSVQGDDELRAWFDIDGRKLPVGDIQSLLGLTIYRVKSLPKETLILCCSKYPSVDPAELSMAIKTTIELRRENVTSGNKDAGRSGGHPQEHARAVDPLALSTRGLRRVAWSPSGETRHGGSEGGG